MFEPRKNNIPGQRADEPQAQRPDDVEIEHLRDCLADALERAANDGTDVSEIQKCLQKLQETAETPIPVDVEDKFRQFQEKHAELLRDNDGGSAAPDDRHRRRRKWTWIGLIAAVVALLSIMFMAGASDNGIQNIFAHWNDDVLFFVGEGESSHNTQANSADDVMEFKSLEDALETYEITEEIIPQQILERYELKSVIAIDVQKRFTTIRAEYCNIYTEKHYNLELKKYFEIADAQACLFEKDNSTVNEYVNGDTTYFIFNNPAGNVATWLSGNLLCTISGDISIQDLYKIINSIHGGK